ncbi:MAG: hypothetical protein MUO50_08770, partial [Longimicrobiales bacterium]|nr:hypothetical protein [Longimicrobiales bacterium]
MWNPFPGLMKRKVVQWGTAYVAVAVGLVEVLDIVGGRFRWPEFLLEAGIVVLAFGLPATVVLAWFHGENGRQRVGGLEASLLLGIVVLGGATLWLVRGEDEAVSVVAAVGFDFLDSPEPSDRRIAILPFDNLSQAGGADSSLADGLHEEIITQLSKVSSLEVVSRTSVMRYQDRGGRSLHEIAGDLGVWYLVEGTFQKVGDRIRMSAHLVDARSDQQLWTESYDEVASATAYFDVQSDVAARIAEALEARLSSTESARIGGRQTENDLAYDAYLRGRQMYGGSGSSSSTIQRANELFRQAVTLDSTFATAWAALAGTYVAMGNFFLAPPEDVFPQAKFAALRALELDRTLTEPRVLLAWVHFSFEREWGEVEQELTDALSVSPNDFGAHYLRAYFLQAMGRHDEAIEEGLRLLQLDPVSGGGHRAAARMFHIGRRYEEAVEVMQRAMELTPSATGGHFYQALTFEQMGREEEAVAALQRAAL